MYPHADYREAVFQFRKTFIPSQIVVKYKCMGKEGGVEKEEIRLSVHL